MRAGSAVSSLPLATQLVCGLSWPPSQVCLVLLYPLSPAEKRVEQWGCFSFFFFSSLFDSNWWLETKTLSTDFHIPGAPSRSFQPVPKFLGAVSNKWRGQFFLPSVLSLSGEHPLMENRWRACLRVQLKLESQCSFILSSVHQRVKWSNACQVAGKRALWTGPFSFRSVLLS